MSLGTQYVKRTTPFGVPASKFPLVLRMPKP